MSDHDPVGSQLQNALEGSDDDDIARALSELIQQLGDNTDSVISLFTELTQREIRHLSVLAIQDDAVTRDFVNSYETHKVSHMRRGRKELINIAEAMGSLRDDAQDSLKDRIVSRLK